MIARSLFFFGVAALALLQGCQLADSSSDHSMHASPHTSENLHVIAASDACFAYEGRVDFANPKAPVFAWQATRLRADFEGGSLALHFGNAWGQSFFDVTVDGQTQVVAVREGRAVRFVWPQALSNGRHSLSVFKRSEAAAGHAAFLGAELAPGASIRPPVLPAYRLNMEFYGDSITVGACNEDGIEDQWEDRSTHNNARSYGALTAAAFAGDYRCIAVSGMGIVTGFVEVRAGEVWDKLYPLANAPIANLKAWAPDIVFVNFGENDAAFTQTQGKPFPSAFSSGYVSLVRSLRKAYPAAHIVLLRGGMSGGANNPDLRRAWDAACSELEAFDSAISHFVFTQWSPKHPRASEDKLMADELIAWLRTQPFMR